MNKGIVVLGLAAVLAAVCLSSSGQTASRPAGTGTASAATSSAPAVDPNVLAILKLQENARAKFPIVQWDLDYLVELLQVADTEVRKGYIVLQLENDKQSAAFRIHFDSLKLGNGPVRKQATDYVFDGEWLTVRKELAKSGQMSRYQVAPPGQKIQPLQLGKGPFPIPYGQSSDDVIKFFNATTRSLKDGEPKDSLYLRLAVRPDKKEEMSVKWLEVWVDKNTGLPVKMIAMDRAEANKSTIVFSNTKTPDKLPADTFVLPKPPPDWEYTVEPFKAKPADNSGK